MTTIVNVYVFEDTAMTLLREGICEFWPGHTVPSTLGDFRFRFGQCWNGLGDAEEVQGLGADGLIKDESGFLRAADFLETGAIGNSIMFFDFEFLDVTLGPQFEAWVCSSPRRAVIIEALEDVAEAKGLEEVLRFFNNERHGLLLATICASRALPGLDIWLATSLETPDVLEKVQVKLSRMSTAGLFTWVDRMTSITSCKKQALVTDLKQRCRTYVDRRNYSWRDLIRESGWGHEEIDTASPKSAIGFRVASLFSCSTDDIFVSSDGEYRFHENLKEWLKELKGHRDFKVTIGAIWVLIMAILRGRTCEIGRALELKCQFPVVLPAVEEMDDAATQRDIFQNWLLRFGDVIEGFLSRDTSEAEEALVKVVLTGTEISIHWRYPTLDKLKMRLAEWQRAASQFLDRDRTQEVSKLPSRTQITMPLLRFYMEGIVPYDGRVQFGLGCEARFEIRGVDGRDGSKCVLGFFTD
jgi:hypothetical protein